jgi:hypothetical protein
LKNISYKINELDLDEKKKQKTLDAISKFNENLLKDFLWKYDSLKNKLLEAGKRIDTNTVTREVEDLNYKLKHTQEQIEKTEGQVEKLKTEIKSLSVENAIKELQMKISRLAPVVIT